MAARAEVPVTGSITRVDSTAQYPVGTIQVLRGATGLLKYRYQQLRNAVVQGTLVKFWTADKFRVTNSASAILAHFPAGVALATASAGNYVFVQYRGANTYILGTGSIARGDMIGPHTATASRCRRWVSGGSGLGVTARPPLARAFKDDSGSIVNSANLIIDD